MLEFRVRIEYLTQNGINPEVFLVRTVLSPAHSHMIRLCWWSFSSHELHSHTITQSVSMVCKHWELFTPLLHFPMFIQQPVSTWLEGADGWVNMLSCAPPAPPLCQCDPAAQEVQGSSLIYLRVTSCDPGGLVLSVRHQTLQTLCSALSHMWLNSPAMHAGKHADKPASVCFLENF